MIVADSPKERCNIISDFFSVPPMSLRPSSKGASRAWEVAKSHGGLYSGGKVALFHPAGRPVLGTLYVEDVALVDVASGQARSTTKGYLREKKCPCNAQECSLHYEGITRCRRKRALR